jgi:hypothetical protein
MDVFGTASGWFDSVFSTVSSGFDSAKSSLLNAMASVGNTAQSWSVEWQNAVDNLKEKAKEFTKVFSQLQSDSGRVPQNLRAEYDAIMSRGSWVKATIQQVTSGIDSAWSAVQSIPMLNGLRNVNNLRGMGIVPLIPIAVIAGAVAVIVAWLSDAYSLQQKINLAKSTGASPSQAANIIGAGSGSTAGGFIQSVGTLLLIGAAVFLFLPTIQKAVKGGK